MYLVYYLLSTTVCKRANEKNNKCLVQGFTPLRHNHISQALIQHILFPACLFERLCQFHSLSKPSPRPSEDFLMASNITAAATSSQHPASFSMPISASAQAGIAILSLAFLLGFPGNLFVVWSVLCRVKKRSVTCLLVLNLSAADAFVLLSAPFFLRYLAGGRGWEFGSAACKLVHYLSNVNMYVSIYLICLMSMDRWLAVTRPFLSQRMRTKRSLLVLLLGIWILAFILSLPMPFYRR